MSHLVVLGILAFAGFAFRARSRRRRLDAVTP